MKLTALKRKKVKLKGHFAMEFEKNMFMHDNSSCSSYTVEVFFVFGDQSSTHQCMCLQYDLSASFLTNKNIYQSFCLD